MTETNGKKEYKYPPAKILIGVPILAWSHEFATSFLNFWTDVITNPNKDRVLNVAYRFAYRRPVHMAQCELAEAAVETGCTHLLLMDDDIYDVNYQSLKTLLDADKELIGGIMYTSQFPYSMCAFRRYRLGTKISDQPILHGVDRLYEIPPEQRVGIQEADLIPFGFTLINTSVFSKLKKPWFQCNVQAPTDSWFMDSVMDAGIKPYAHFDVWLNHNGVTPYNRELKSNLAMAEMQHKNKAQVIHLNQEDMRRHMVAMDLKMKEAEAQRKLMEHKDVQFVGGK